MRGRMDFDVGWLEYDVLAEPVRIGDRQFPPILDVVFPGAPDQPRVEMTLAVVNGFPQCRSLTVSSKDGGREVRTADLRSIPIDAWVEQLYSLVASEIVRDEAGSIASVLSADPALRRKTEKAIQQARDASRRTITDELLQEVAEVYRSNIDGRPVEAVRARFGGKYRTAAYYVERARAAGHLPPTTPGKRRA